MRNPQRISELLALLGKAWATVPDWRLGQLVSNLLGAGPHDVFFVEDEEWKLLLQQFIAGPCD